MNTSFHDISIIWLDDHIGSPNDYIHLKRVFARNIDPSTSDDLSMVDIYDNIDYGSCQFSTIDFGIASQLAAFTKSASCLNYICESIREDKQIYIIVSDVIGQTFVPQICSEYTAELEDGRIQIYVLQFYEWLDLDWQMEYADYLLTFGHELDLLCRLLRDISHYYVKIGERSLEKDIITNIHQALTYFYWAKILLGRADKLDAHLALKPMRYVNSLINQVDRMIETRDDSLLDDSYFEEDLLANLRNSTFIYCTVEQRSAGDELVTLLKTLTHEEGVLFDNGSEFIANLKEIHSRDHICPIIISENIKDETNILKELSSMACVHQIYILSIRDHPSVTESDQMLLKEFPNAQKIYYQSRALALQWAAERASICERIGEFCAENMNRELAQKYYQKAIELNQNSSVFLTKRN
ncbi:unnamed protein product [Adineta ricciae]|uniref:Uncharacterized protein n=2 Tax=Adineta ricciae TaxID=249248 RepID=A0A815G6V8_ADIRI|nr:unnamed protein product [Adineta ricciae]